MADKKLNEVTKVTDMAYVPVIMSDGSIGQIAKADLASVVAGIVNPLLCGLAVVNRDINDNLNNLTSPGIYNFVDNNSIVANNPGIKYGVVIVFVAAHSYIAQIALDSSNLWFRFMNPSQSQYNGWRKVSVS